MFIRTWKTSVHPDRVDDLETFAEKFSLPMFREQPGCLGVLFARDGAYKETVSFWEDQEAIERLATSPSYEETVRRIEETGMLQGEQTVTILPLYGGYLKLDEMERRLS